MNKAKKTDKIIASVLGAYSGTILATGIFVIFGGNLNTGAWWGWIEYSLMWGTIVSTPISLILMFSLVRVVFKLIVNNNTPTLQRYALVGLISGTAPILLIYIITLIYYLASNASVNEYASTVIPFLIFLLYGALCGILCLAILFQISYNKSLNLTGADNAPPS